MKGTKLIVSSLLLPGSVVPKFHQSRKYDVVSQYIYETIEPLASFRVSNTDGI